MAVETNVKTDPQALAVPAPFVNKFQILVAGGNVRLAFAEGFADQPGNYRSAVSMGAQDALELAVAIITSLPSGITLSAPLNPQTLQVFGNLLRRNAETTTRAQTKGTTILTAGMDNG
jgi:hypothetical protein